MKKRASLKDRLSVIQSVRLSVCPSVARKCSVNIHGPLRRIPDEFGNLFKDCVRVSIWTLDTMLHVQVSWKLTAVFPYTLLWMCLPGDYPHALVAPYWLSSRITIKSQILLIFNYNPQWAFRLHQTYYLFRKTLTLTLVTAVTVASSSFKPCYIFVFNLLFFWPHCWNTYLTMTRKRRLWIKSSRVWDSYCQSIHTIPGMRGRKWDESHANPTWI